ncbi:MAG: glycine--tRNA ligase subunit beta [Alphaproteobacteria bacterium]|nr:glycine--tRNA ligase subunit beta [Alphaproteobacteria bacterium]MCB9796789.1 glycine--tRNA ligase subunit beta [Alphaproteobacteria bacterium]
MSDLLIELRSEELPVSMIAPALDALAKGLLELLEGVAHGELRRFSTPRRLCVVVEGVAEGRPEVESLVTGPPLAAAKRNGEWTKAAAGFARGRGVDVEDLIVATDAKGREVVGARITEGGERTVDLVAAGLEKLVLGLPFRKSMRWADGAARWGRPLHQVVAVYGGARIPASVAGIETSAEVLGHRRAELGPAPVSGAADYLHALRTRYVMADREARRAHVAENVRACAAAEGVEAVLDDALLDEVTDLVEWPVPMVGRFEAELLELPERLLEESMRVHQRYFPSRRDGRLHNVFFIVSNNPHGDPETIAAGNARVIAARFHDAQFFYAEDRKKSLAQHGAGLVKMRWVRGLGTMAQKQDRVAALGARLAEGLGADAAVAREAGALTKADLLSQMVGEFPKLQGHMGRLYAAHEGRPEAVAQAIEEHYLPRYAGDEIAASPAGRALALADRLDTLAGCFGIGLVPKGSADPQGLRRATIGVLATLLGAGSSLGLGALIDAALDGYEASGEDAVTIKRPRAEVRAELLDFMLGRLRGALMAEGHSTDIVDAVLAAGGDVPLQLQARVAALTRLSEDGGFKPLMVTFKRVMNITKGHESADYDAAHFSAPAEQALAGAVEAASARVLGLTEALDFEAALAEMATLKAPVDRFFDDVLVMAEDEAIRASRLGLLNSVAALFKGVADFSHISTE